jgi:hypothetical protein
VQQVMGLVQVGPLQVPAVGVDRASPLRISRQTISRRRPASRRAVGVVAQEGLVLDHPGQAGVVQEALHGQLLVGPDPLHRPGVLEPPELSMSSAQVGVWRTCSSRKRMALSWYSRSMGV